MPCRLVASSCLLLLLFLPGAAAAQDFHTDGPELKVNANTGYGQDYCRIAASPSGDVLAFAFQTVGSAIAFRVLDRAGNELVPETLVNTTQVNGTQDEPAIARNKFGDLLVAWSDHNGYDGSSIGVFGRFYDAAGVPQTGEVQLNVEWQQSQYEPMLAATPAGDFVAVWAGRSNADVFMRLFERDGTPITGDIQVNTLPNGAQVSPSVAVSPGGTILVAFHDQGGNGTGGGSSVYGRRFDTAGVPLGPEFQLHQTLNAGVQREPRVAVDARGRFVVAWEDSQADGNGYGIVCRRFAESGAPLEPEFVVNTTTFWDQADHDVAVDAVGNFVVVWRDISNGFEKIMARRYDQHAAPLDDEFEVRIIPDVHLWYPDVSVDGAGEDFVFTYTAPGVGVDVYAKRYAFEPIHVVTPTVIGATFLMDLHFPGGAGYYRFMMGSFATSPGVSLPDGREVPLAWDQLFNFSLTFPNGGFLDGFQGFLDGVGKDSASVAMPNDPVFLGLTMYFAAVTVDATQVGLANQLRHVTDPVQVVIGS